MLLFPWIPKFQDRGIVLIPHPPAPGSSCLLPALHRILEEVRREELVQLRPDQHPNFQTIPWIWVTLPSLDFSEPVVGSLWDHPCSKGNDTDLEFPQKSMLDAEGKTEQVQWENRRCWQEFSSWDDPKNRYQGRAGAGVGSEGGFPKRRIHRRAVPLHIPIPEGNEELDVPLQQHPEGLEGAGVSWYRTTKLPSPSQSRAEAPLPALPERFPPFPGHPKGAKANPRSCLFPEHSCPHCLHVGPAGELPPSLRNEAFPKNPPNSCFYNHNTKSSLNFGNHPMSLAGITPFSCLGAGQGK